MTTILVLIEFILSSLSLYMSPVLSVHGNCSLPGECECEPGYSGTLCQIDDDVCGHQSPCQNGGTCNSTGPDSHTCACPAGFSGPNCEADVDECTTDPCLNGAICVVSHAASEDVCTN